MGKIDLFQESLTRSVIGAFYDVHNTLGYGFLEPIYIRALERELTWRGHDVALEVSVPVMYKGVDLGRQRLDMLINGKLIIEAKATFELPDIATRQLYNYLRATNLQLGLVLHFGPKPRFHRVFRRLSVAQLVEATATANTHASDQPDASD